MLYSTQATYHAIQPFLTFTRNKRRSILKNEPLLPHDVPAERMVSCPQKDVLEDSSVDGRGQEAAAYFGTSLLVWPATGSM